MLIHRTVLIRFALVLGAAYALILVATAPATLIGKFLPVQAGIRLERLSGTLWQGAADTVTLSSPIGLIQVNALSWDMQWRFLLRGEFALRLETADAAGSLIVARSFGGLRLAQANIALPAVDLAQILPSLALWQPEGEVQFQTQGFAPTAKSSGKANLFWRNAGLNLSPQQTLGDYRLELQTVNQKLDARLETLHGSLKLEGVGSYTQQGGLQFNGSAQADAAHAAALKNLLNEIGSDRGDGVHQISLRQP